MATVARADLPAEVVALGRLTGLLTVSGDTVTIEAGWFDDPASALRGVPDRLDALVELIGGALGPAEAGAPPEPAGAQWYRLPNPLSGAPTPFCVVTPPATAASGEIGTGVLVPIEVGSVRVVPSAYAPLVSYRSGGGADVAFAKPDHPCRLGVRVERTDRARFAVNGTSFTALDLALEIDLSGADPSFTLRFEDLSGNPAGTSDSYSRLADLGDPNVLAWIGDVVTEGGNWLCLAIGGSNVTAGEILAGAGFMTYDSTTALYHAQLDEAFKRTPAENLLAFLFGTLSALASADFPVVNLPGGGVYVDHDPATGDYGVRFSTALTIGGGPATGGKASPSVDLCLGTAFTGETDETNWISRTTGSTVPAGLSAFLVRKAGDGPIELAPRFRLGSAGVNVRGGGGPLVDIGGYTIGGVEARAYFDTHGLGFGFGARIDAVGFPLGQSFGQAQGAGGNPVAGDLLASGNSAPQADGTSAANPAFSAEAGWVEGHPPMLEVLDPQGRRTDVVWFPIQRRLGPLHCSKVGLRLAGAGSGDPVVGVLFDGGVALGALDVELDDLSVGVHVRRPTDPSAYELDLQGLAVTFGSGGVELSGGLIKQSVPNGVTYDGEVLVKAENLALMALGSYSHLDDVGTSLFVFGWLSAPIGGPPAFFVTGLAAGFGYNRTLTLPAENQVRDFPLVGLLADPGPVAGSARPDPAAVLPTLDKWIAPERGEYWAALGVQFTSFEIVNTVALIAVEFGRELVIALLGISTLRQPPEGPAYVYAELDIEAVLRPTEGEFKASAVLAPSSYVLMPSVHLTGGFACSAWFGDNDHAGDFAITLGGYHPAFKPPAHYPQVPRLGIDWPDGDVRITGTAYFALTPAAVMAGGGLQVTYTSGALKAWLRAQVDVIIFWKPFYLTGEASISVGVSYRAQFAFFNHTFSVEISADFKLWGPPIGYSVHIDWYVISFTIGSGSPSPPADLSWSEFKGMLPSKPNPGPVVLHITASDGLASAGSVDGIAVWLVRPGTFRFAVGSAVPASQIVVESADRAHDEKLPGRPVAMRNLEGGIPSSAYSSTQSVTVLALESAGAAEIQRCMATADPCTTRPAGCADPAIDLTQWNVAAVEQEVPQAMWGAQPPAGNPPAIGASDMTLTATVGVTMRPGEPAITGCTPEMVIDDVFEDRTVNPDRPYGLSISASAATPPAPTRAPGAFADIAAVNDGAAQRRAELFATLQAVGVDPWTNEPLPRMAAQPGDDFADEPMEASVA